MKKHLILTLLLGTAIWGSAPEVTDVTAELSVSRVSPIVASTEVLKEEELRRLQQELVTIRAELTALQATTVVDPVAVQVAATLEAEREAAMAATARINALTWPSHAETAAKIQRRLKPNPAFFDQPDWHRKIGAFHSPYIYDETVE